MKLQTQIPINAEENQIDYNSRLLLLGSCFSEHIGDKFEYYKFQSLQNPFGILFHPKAIENVIERSIRSNLYSEKELFFYNERWHCFDSHSALSSLSKEELLANLNKGLSRTVAQITTASHIVITLGTAWVYHHIEQNKDVANCHKVPQTQFLKKLQTAKAIEESLNNSINIIKSVNSSVQLIFTISPVRHLKDGFVENQRSKAHLITAVQNIIGQGSAAYFPSYELMMDELRDYRFYKTDMVHPNQLAIDYIWEKFSDVWISPKVYSIMKKVDAIQMGLRHRPFNSQAEKHKDFLKSLDSKITYLQQTYPFINFSK